MGNPPQRNAIRSRRYEKLKRKIGFHKLTDEFGQKSIAATSSVLEHFDSNDQSDC